MTAVDATAVMVFILPGYVTRGTASIFQPSTNHSMNENLSSNAIIYAILSLNSEIALQKEYLDSDHINHDERENEEDILSDMEQAFMEFIGVYKTRRKHDKTLPNIDELLTTEL